MWIKYLLFVIAVVSIPTVFLIAHLVNLWGWKSVLLISTIIASIYGINNLGLFTLHNLQLLIPVSLTAVWVGILSIDKDALKSFAEQGFKFIKNRITRYEGWIEMVAVAANIHFEHAVVNAEVINKTHWVPVLLGTFGIAYLYKKGWYEKAKPLKKVV